jgi:energy-converting hydrogenase A subunit B
MLDEPIRILIAALICWLNFMIIDLIFKLPERGGVSGATAIAQEVEKGGGKLNGGYMMGNIVSSPDASAGTLLASCGVYCAGLPGGLFAALLVYIGNRICYDPGYAGTSGCITATFIVYGAVQSGWFAASDPYHPGIIFCPCEQAYCAALEDQVPVVAGVHMIALYVCAAIAVYAALRVISERNTMRKLPFLNVVSFAVTGIIALLLPHPLTIAAAAAYFVGSTLESNAIASTWAGGIKKP